MNYRAVLLALLAGSATADTLSGRVVAIADGDTLTILDTANVQHKIRLAEIDAPEKAQPFGARSKQALSDICFDKSARVEDRGRDRYGRTIGHVNCAGIDANSEQIRQGMAWVFDRYATSQTLYTLQSAARSARLGLWSDQAPMPPWEWRRR